MTNDEKTHPIAIGCSARVIAEADPPGSRAFVGRLVEVINIATEHAWKDFPGVGAYVIAPGFGWWFPIAALEWAADEPPVWPRKDDADEPPPWDSAGDDDDDDEDSCEDCEDLRADIACLTAENARLSRLNGRRERQIARARLQEEGTPVTPEWLDWVERLYIEARVTQRVCSALRRAWAERDTARDALSEIDREITGCFGAGIAPSETLAGIIRRIVADALAL